MMDTKILKLLEGVTLKEKQEYKNLTVFPLIYTNGNKAEYISLDEALQVPGVEITELTEGGSVPELYFINSSDFMILLLDGEELIGAKQNRILNRSILIEKQAKIKIPVSCVESGRWSYNSKTFASSNRISPSSVKMKKMESVSRNLYESRGMNARSDQHEVWQEVDRISYKARVESPSNAMSDVFENKAADIDSYLQNFTAVEGQNGLIVMINGSIVGMEYISNKAVFPKLFAKLIRGYAMDALLDIKNFKKVDAQKECINWISGLSSGTEDCFKSSGLGDDHRINARDFVASALSYNEEIIHFSALNKIEYSDSRREQHFSSRPYIRRTMR